MKRLSPVSMLILSLFILMGCSSKEARSSSPVEGVVSLAPSVTEMLFALNQGDRVVGVTSACDYPSEASAIPKVGGFMTPQFEAIMASGATWVVGMEGSVPEKAVAKLEETGKRVLLLKDKSVEDVLSSMERLGAELGVPEAGKQLRKAVEKDMKPTPFSKVEGQPRGILVISRDPLMVAGPSTFVSELMVLAGVQNVVEDGPMPYPTWTKENLIAGNPDWIIEARMTKENPSDTSPWASLNSVSAVKQQHIRSVNADWLLRPGPRMAKGVRAIREALKPRNKEGR
jgi:iron complex transport system substrate-binding protein